MDDNTKIKLFVGNLSWGTNNDQLQEHFSQIGPVTSATVIFDRQTGKSKGFGFVEMTTEEDAEKALDLDGSTLDGREIVVNKARPRAPRDNNGGGYRRDRQ